MNASANEITLEGCARRLLHARHLAAYRWALPFLAGRRVLEIGVNTGYGLEVIASEAASLVGLDLSPSHAREAHEHTGVPVVQANGQQLPFQDGAFDAVVSFQVIEHVWDVAAFLSETRRVVRPGGVVLLSTPQRRARLLRGQVPWNDEHLREYDERDWAGALSTTFGDGCEVLGLHGDEVATSLERRRIWQDPLAHYFGGPWARPLRAIGRRLVGRWRAFADSASANPDLASLARADDELLTRRFFVDGGRIEACLDLLAVCPVEATSALPPRPFDAEAYWRDRLTARLDLTGTGTSGYPVSWQRWLYRGKLRAIERVLAHNGVELAGASVLDLGCGTGFFEDVWERRGARRADGIDLVPEAVEVLQRAHPHRRYVCADLSRHPEALERLARPDLITAIDVLYHIVDDQKLYATIRALASKLRPGGWFLFSDALLEAHDHPHVRFRSLNHWRQLLRGVGLELVDREPTFALNNRAVRGLQRAPSLIGAAQHGLDLLVLRTMPWLANNWTVLARRVDR